MSGVNTPYACCTSLVFSDSDEEHEKRVERPTIEIDIDEVEFLRALQLTWTKMAEIMGISRRTLYRRLKEEDILENLKFSDICDADLDELLIDIKREHPNDGEILIRGHLAARNVRIQRSRLQAAIHRIDPVSTAERRRTAIVR